MTDELPRDIRTDAVKAAEEAERAAERLDAASAAARRFGAAMADALKAGVSEGRRFDDILKGVGQRLLQVAADLALRALGQSLTAGLKGLLGGGGVQPFAKGGVVGGPTLFPLPSGLGLMGEAGAEAILPLARGPDGRLGIRASETEIAAPVSVVVNVTTPDAASFVRSESSVSAALARAVARGRRTL